MHIYSTLGDTEDEFLVINLKQAMPIKYRELFSVANIDQPSEWFSKMSDIASAYDSNDGMEKQVAAVDGVKKINDSDASDVEARTISSKTAKSLGRKNLWIIKCRILKIR